MVRTHWLFNSEMGACELDPSALPFYLGLGAITDPVLEMPAHFSLLKNGAVTCAGLRANRLFERCKPTARTFLALIAQVASLAYTVNARRDRL